MKTTMIGFDRSPQLGQQQNVSGYEVRSIDDASWDALGRGLINTDEAISPVLNGVSLISGSIASLTPFLMKQDDSGKRVMVSKDHPVWSLLKQPSRYFNWFQFVSFIHRSLLLTGNAYVIVEDDQLIPVDGRHVTCHYGFRNIVYEVVVGYPFQARKTQRMTSDNLIHFKSLAIDPYSLCGIAPLDRCPAVRELAEATQQSVLTSLKQGVYPSLMLKIEDTNLEDEESERIQKRLEKRFAGEHNFQKPVVLGQKVKAENMSVNSAREAQQIESRRFLIAEVARCFNIPVVLLNEFQGTSSYNNIKESIKSVFHLHTLRPWISSFQQTFSNALLEVDEGVSLILDQREYTEGDTLDRRKSIVELFKAGILGAPDTDEARQMARQLLDLE